MNILYVITIVSAVVILFSVLRWAMHEKNLQSYARANGLNYSSPILLTLEKIQLLGILSVIIFTVFWIVEIEAGQWIGAILSALCAIGVIIKRSNVY